MTELLAKIVEKYALLHNQKIYKKELIDIAYKEKVKLNELVFLLGCYSKIVYKSNYSWTRINIENRNLITRDKVNMIKLDLKYIKKYGERYYNKKEIQNICEKYKVNYNDFITYIYKYKICYYNNIEILENNILGLWIGENKNVSKEFINRNYLNLESKIKKIASSLTMQYNCYYLKEKIVDRAKDYLLTLGKIEKNYEYDDSIIINKMLYRVKYEMLKEIIKEYRNINNYKFDLFKVSDNYNIGPNSKHIKEWLYDVKFNCIEKIILREIIKKLDEFIEDRKHELNNITIKLNINKTELIKNVQNIRKKLIENNKVKITKNGSVIIGKL